MLLSEAPRGEYRIDAVLLAPALRRRLAALGIIYRAEMTVLRKKNTAAALVRVCGVKYALGARIADGVLLSGKKCGS